MNEIEERVYTLTDSANSLAAELYDALEMIRYDPVGATPDDMEFMKEINGLLTYDRRVNKLLADISVRDELTGLYNRMGYEKIAIPYLDELRRANRNSVIMVADINRMKVINDKFGHLQGDTAIKIVASVIKSTVPKEWKAVRYGGDEYVIIGEYEASEDMEKIKKELIEKVKRVAQDLDMPFKLSISVGYVIIDTDDHLGNEEYFRMADEAMYEMKQIAHNQENNT